MVRNRYLRIKRGRWLTEQGRSKNRCGICGELKRGHVCKSTPQGPFTPKVLGPDDEDAQSNSSTVMDPAASTPNKRDRDDDAEDDEVAEEEEENAAPTPMRPTNVVLDPSPSIASLQCATATVTCEPPAAPSPHPQVRPRGSGGGVGAHVGGTYLQYGTRLPQVAGVKKLCKLERQGSLEVLAVAASLVANPTS